MGEIAEDMYGNCYWKPQSQMVGEYYLAKFEKSIKANKKSTKVLRP